MSNLRTSSAARRAWTGAALLVLGAGSLASAALAAQSHQVPAHTGRARSAPPKAYVTNAGAGTVSVIETATSSVLGTIAVGTSPSKLALSPDGSRAYVPNVTADTLSVIDTATDAVVATIPAGDAPSVVAVAPDGSRVYVGGGSGLVRVIDAAQLSVVATISAGAPASGTVAGLAVAPDGTRVYALWGDLVVIDAATNAVVSSIYAGNTTTGLAIAPDGSRVYASYAFGFGAFSFVGGVAIVDAATESVTGTITTYSLPTSIAISPDGTRAYVSTPSVFVDTGYGAGYIDSPWVVRLDLVNGTMIGGVNAGSPARGLAYTSNGARVYVATATGGVKLIDVATNALAGAIAVGNAPSGVAIQP